MSATYPPMWRRSFPDAELIGDIGASCHALEDRLEGKLKSRRQHARLAAERSSQHIDGRRRGRPIPVTPQRLVHDVRAVMPEDGIVCLDNGMYKIWFARNYPNACGRTRVLLDNALATMGAGLPSAMAAAMVYPDRKVHGDLRRRRLHDEQPGDWRPRSGWGSTSSCSSSTTTPTG